MIQHIPITIRTVASLATDVLVWLFLELVVWAGVMVLGEHPSFWGAGFRRAEHAVNSFARRRSLAVAGMFLFVFFGRLALLSVFPVPPPKITDEFSELLSGDTFAHWRVTNPTHPEWFYFQTIFVNQRPTYTSMYPPGTGLFLAVGEVLTGQPWYGMLLSVALAAASICWMLQGWVPPRWALWGGLVFVLLTVRNSVTENYQGEGIVMLGGALVLGAIPRVIKRRSIGASLWFGTGTALLAITRPYEGAVFVAGVSLGAIIWAARTGWKTTSLVRWVAIPVAAVLVPVFLWTAYLNKKSTGCFLIAPYEINLLQQHITRPFVWQKPVSPPHYDYEAIASHYVQTELNWWERTRGSRGAALLALDKVKLGYTSIVWPFGLVVAVGACGMFASRKVRFVPVAFLFFLTGLGIEAYPLRGKYVEVASGMIVLLAVYGLRYLGVWKRRSHAGLHLSRVAVMLLPASLLFTTGFLYSFESTRITAEQTEPWWAARQQVLDALRVLPGKQLVIVRYSPLHVPYEEWVYNRADIDSAKVVWARDVPERGDADLLRYFNDRTVWLLEPDKQFPGLRLFQYPPVETQASAVGPFRVLCATDVCRGLERQLGLIVKARFSAPAG
jgi:hypothetical protein